MARAHTRKAWAQLRAAYRRGEGSLPELAPKFGIAEQTARKRCAKEQWRVQRNEVGAKAERKAVRRDVESVAAMLRKHRRAAARFSELALRKLNEAVRKRELSASGLDALSKVLGRMVPVERLSAGIERHKPASGILDEAEESGEVEIIWPPVQPAGAAPAAAPAKR